MNNEHKKSHVFGPRPLMPVGDGPELGTQCIQLTIPSGKQAQLQLFGALSLLTKWANFERDANHLGIEWAKAWLGAIQTNFPLKGCEMPIEFMQDECGLNYREIGSPTWIPIYDGLHCLESDGARQFFDGIIGDYIDQLIADGGLPGVGQSGGGGTPEPNKCYDYLVQLNANFRWLCPISIDAGDTVLVSQVQGTWWDGVTIAGWYCIDGHDFFVNACQSGYRTEPTDPLPSVNHMRLVGEIDGTWFDALDGTYIVPSGVTGGRLFLQANDSALSDNMGAANFKVTVCKSTCVAYNFLTSAGPWQVNPDPAWTPAPGIYTLGVGYSSANTSLGGVVRTDCEIVPFGSFAAHNPTIGITLNVVSMGNYNYLAVTTDRGNQGANWTSTGVHTMTFSFSGDMTSIIVDAIASFNGTGGQVEIIEIQVCS